MYLDIYYNLMRTWRTYGCRSCSYWVDQALAMSKPYSQASSL